MNEVGSKTNEVPILEDVNEEESIHKLKGETLQDIPSITAEDDVVAIILSAIMGSIIEKWEFMVVEEKQSELSCEVDTTKEATETEKYPPSESKTQQVDLKQFNEREEELNNIELNSAPLEEELEVTSSTLPIEEEDMERKPVEPQRVLLRSLFASQKEEIFGWPFLETNSNIIITFKQGNRYEGKLLNCRMQGVGKFVWADGCVYEGKFLNGEMTGEGRLQWADQSWYEGQLSRGYRQGKGLYVQRPMFYTGEWKCGQRHGVGTLFYTGAHDHHKNYYSGEWKADRKEGTGLRSYPSGAMYSGEWKEGVRHGLGTMVWTNNDVYSGNWRKGRIHGYGEYTWDSFFNNQLVMPLENCYYGDWKNNVRHGNGTLETSMGVIVKGTWNRGKKDGPAEVICSNGCFTYADNLFSEDCISALSDTSMDADSLDATLRSLKIHKLPVNGANHDIELRYYCDKLRNYIVFCQETGRKFGKNFTINHSVYNPMNANKFVHPKKETGLPFVSPDEGINYNIEEVMLRSTLLQYLSVLKAIYIKYAELCCHTKPTFSPIMMRLMLWQLFRDCDLHNKGRSLADLDVLIAESRVSLVQGVHYPFERLHFWQFLHCLIEISCEFYGKNCTNDQAGILSRSLDKLIKQDILPKAGSRKGNALLKYRDLLCLDSVYWLYSSFGEPHSAKQFMRNVFKPFEGTNIEKEGRDYPEHQTRGKNIIGVGGRLSYSPEKEPVIVDSHQTYDSNHPHDLTCLRDIGLLAVYGSLVEVCPSIMAGGLIVNMDYKIVFLEFFEILLLCAKIKYQKEKAKREDKENKKEAHRVPSSEKLSSPAVQVSEAEQKPDKATKSKRSSKVKKKKK